MVQTAPARANHRILRVTSQIDRCSDVPLFQRGINLVQFIGLPPNSLDRPPDDALQNDRDCDHEDAYERVHYRSALKESLKYRLTFGPVRYRATPGCGDLGGQYGSKPR